MCKYRERGIINRYDDNEDKYDQYYFYKISEIQTPIVTLIFRCLWEVCKNFRLIMWNTVLKYIDHRYIFLIFNYCLSLLKHLNLSFFCFFFKISFEL